MYVVDLGGRVYKIDAQAGRILWTYLLGRVEVFWASPILHDGRLLMGDAGGRLYALDAADGTLRWTFDAGSEIRTSLAASRGVLYFGAANGSVYAVDVATGGLAWRFATGDEIWGSTAVVGDTVYSGSTDEYLYAIAAGVPPGGKLDTSATRAPDPEPEFVPLTVEEAKELLESSRSWKLLAGTRQLPDGTVETISTVDEVFRLYELGHYLLTGKPSRWIPLAFPLQEFQHLTRDPQLAHAGAWCCRRTADGNLELIIRGDLQAHDAIDATAHEAGHARQQSRNPGQSDRKRDSNIGALHEAQAYAFATAVIRKLAEYTETNATVIPSEYSTWATGRIDSIRRVLHDSTEEHERGRALLWSAVMNDPALADLEAELRRNGILSADGAFALHEHLVGIGLDEADGYVADLLDAVRRRVGQGDGLPTKRHDGGGVLRVQPRHLRPPLTLSRRLHRGLDTRSPSGAPRRPSAILGAKDCRLIEHLQCSQAALGHQVKATFTIPPF